MHHCIYVHGRISDRCSGAFCRHAAKAESAKKAALADRLQDLCRSLQAQNRGVKEEDAAKRKEMLDSFQASIEDIKSKCGGHPACCIAALSTCTGLGGLAGYRPH